MTLASAPGWAALGDCGQPATSGAQPTATDCLFILRAAVNTETCDPECVCDTNADDATTATDALVCLKRAVGQNVELACRCPVSPVDGQVQVNTHTGGEQLRPAVAADVDGNFVVAWESSESDGPDTDGYGILAQRFDETGQPAGTEFQLNAFTTGHQFFVSLAPDPQGGFVAAWDSQGASASDGNGSVRAQRFAVDGSPLGTEFQVNTYTDGTQGTASVAVDPEDGGFVVVWQSYGSSDTDTSKFSIQGQRFDADGNPAGTEFQVNTLTGDSQVAPTVAFRSNGGFVVAWTSLAGSGTDPDANVRAQLFDADGARDATEFRVNSYTTGTQSSPAVAPDGANGFTIVWTSAGSSSDSDTGVVGRRFGATAVPSAEFPVNAYATGAQTNASIAALDGGRFVVVWHGEASAQGDTDYAVNGQVFDAGFDPIGTEFQVNTFTSGEQFLPQVAAAPSGDFMVVWQSEGSVGSDTAATSIQGQRFE